jgi:hypothetical protein
MGHASEDSEQYFMLNEVLLSEETILTEWEVSQHPSFTSLSFANIAETSYGCEHFSEKSS